MIKNTTNSTPTSVSTSGNRIARVIKVFLVTIAVVVGILVVLSGTTVLLLQKSSVQTYLIQAITARVSEEIGADVQIGHFHYQPLNRLTIDSVYLSDQQRDTLAFVEHIHIHFHPLLLRQNRLDLTLVELDSPYLNIQAQDDSTLNCQYLLNLFGTDSTSFPLRVNIDKLQLTDTRVRYKELLVDRLNMDMTMPVLSSDSMDFTLHALTLRAQMDRLNAGFEATLRGNLDSLFAEKMQLVYRGRPLFSGDVAVYYPTRLDSLYIHADCNDLFCNYALLQDMLSELLLRPVHLPKPVAALGDVHYAGNVDGRLDDITLHGTFKTSVGSIRVNGDVHTDTLFEHLAFCGYVSTRRLHLGRLLNQKDVGVVAMRAHIDGRLEETFTCTADVDIQKIEYKGYTYRDIRFNGGFADQEINGTLCIDDENIGLRFDGLADFAESDTRLDFALRVNHFRPGAMHLLPKYPTMEIGGMAYVSLFTSGNNISQVLDNMTGYVIVDTLVVGNNDQTAIMEQMKIEVDNVAQGTHPAHQLRIQSDYLTAGISGPFSYTTLPSTIQTFLWQYIPALVSTDTPSPKKRMTNDIDFYVYLRDIEQITQVLDLDIDIPSYPTLKGFIYESDNQLGLQAYIPQLITSGAWMEDVTLAIDNMNNRLNLSLYVLNHLPQDNPTAAKIGDVRAYANITAKDDVVGLTVKLDNTDSIRNEGIIRVSSRIAKYDDKPLLNVHIHPSDIVLNDSVWSIGDAHILYNSSEKTLAVEHFRLNTNHQSIHAHGMASANAEDSILVELQNINVNYLLGYTNASQALSVDGFLTGWATIYGLFSQPMFEAQAVIPEAGLNGVPLGRAVAEAHLNREEKTMVITGDVIDTTSVVIAHVDGLVKPEKRWELDINCDSVNLGIVNFWTKGILSNLKGLGYGHLHIDGHERDTYITAAMYGKNAQLTVPQIGATFTFSDSVFMDSTSIRFPHITLYDTEGHRGTFDGVLTHTLFEDFRYDMTASVSNMLALNLPYDPQAMFYGKVYGTGDVTIRGDEQECRIGVNARTDAKSKFYLSVATASTASTASFINFVQPDTSTNSLLSLLHSTPQKSLKKKTKSNTRVILSLLVEATPMAEINLRMGGDDGLRGVGEGNLRLDYDDRTGDVQLLGTYTLQSGLFSFSLGNIVRRNFDIAEGSRVIWNGDPTSPTVDVTGKYHLTASLRDLYGSDAAQISTNRTSVPVNCVLRMTDQLFNPIISFAIELPQSDEAVQSQVRSIINTNEMLMRQIIYLLVFNRFYTPEYLQNTKNVGLNETYSLLSSTLTGQINSWLSKLTDVFTMGFNIRTDGEGANASQEYEANFQIHPINQLLINGNFGYRYNDISNRPFFGDLDIEYILTENGKLRLKAYTHTVDKYSLKQANTVQGVGFVFKHDFNWSNRQRRNSIAK